LLARDRAGLILGVYRSCFSKANSQLFFYTSSNVTFNFFGL
jgi:hypothetical protein